MMKTKARELDFDTCKKRSEGSNKHWLEFIIEDGFEKENRKNLKVKNRFAAKQ